METTVVEDHYGDKIEISFGKYWGHEIVHLEVEHKRYQFNLKEVDELIEALQKAREAIS